MATKYSEKMKHNSHSCFINKLFHVFSAAPCMLVYYKQCVINAHLVYLSLADILGQSGQSLHTVHTDNQLPHWRYNKLGCHRETALRWL